MRLSHLATTTLVLFLSNLILTACQHLSSVDGVPAVSDPWAFSPKKPTRLLILYFSSVESAAPEASAPPARYPHVTLLEQHAAVFKTARVGHLFATDAIAPLVIDSGLMPRNLPWQDRIYFDPKGRTREVGPLTPAAAKIFLEKALKNSLIRKIKAVNSDPSFVLSENLNPTAVLGEFSAEQKIPGNAVVEFLQTHPKWSVVAANFTPPTPSGTKWSDIDRQLGPILEALKLTNRLSETAILLVAGRAIQKSPTVVSKSALKPLANFVRLSIEDTALRFWLKKRDNASLAKFSGFAHNLPGIAEIYTKQSTGTAFHYIRTFRNPTLAANSLESAKNFNLGLVESVANVNSPDVIGLLMPGVSYRENYETGGAQEAVQNIPLMIWARNLKLPPYPTPVDVRLVDVNPMISQVMGLGGEGLDGVTSPIEALVGSE